MSKLMRANLSRMFRCSAFWIAVIAWLVFTILVIRIGCILDITAEVFRQKLEYRMACAFLCFPFFQAVFISLFLGAEKRDGMIRNKLVVGHTKTEVYLSNFLTCVIGSLGLLAAWLVGSLLMIPCFRGWGAWALKSREALLFLLLYFLSATAGAAIYVLMAHVCVYGSSVLFTNLLLTVLLMITGMITYGILSFPVVQSTPSTCSIDIQKMPSEMRQLREQEYQLRYHMSWLDIMETHDIEKTTVYETYAEPQYVGGMRRRFYLAVASIIPIGQHLYQMNRARTGAYATFFQVDGVYYGITGVGQHTNVEMTWPGMICGSLFLIFVVTGVGLWIFRKENLK